MAFPKMGMIGGSAFFMLNLLASHLSAQGVTWRTDFAEARREAVKTNRPLLLDFGTEACTWCKKQDATTFRDPAVIKLLNAHFIAVKIDAERDSRRADALGVHSYPTIIIAGADGKVLDRHEGYADARDLVLLLNKVRKATAVTTEDSPVSAFDNDDVAIIRCRVTYEK